MTAPWPVDASTTLHEVDGAPVVDATTRDGLTTRYTSQDDGRTWLDPDAVSALLDCDGEGIPADPTLPLRAEIARLKGRLAALIEHDRRREVEAIAKQRGRAVDAQRARQRGEEEARWAVAFPCPKERREAQEGRRVIMADYAAGRRKEAARRGGMTLRQRLREDDERSRQRDEPHDNGTSNCGPGRGRRDPTRFGLVAP